MTEKTVAQKMHVKPGVSIAFMHAPDGFARLLDLPSDVTVVTDAEAADVVVLTVTTQAELEERLPATQALIGPAATLWIVYPKGSKAAGLDISRDTIWPVAEALGMRPVAMVSIDERWSGFRVKLAP